MNATLLECEPPAKGRKAVLRAAEMLARGALVVFPTETVYGVGARVDQTRAVNRLSKLKQRSGDKPFSVHLGSVEAADRLVDVAGNPTLGRLLRRAAPGPITFVVEVPDDVIEAKLAALGGSPPDRNLIYYRNTVGLRIVDHPVAQPLLDADPMPVIASSANHHGRPEPHDADQAREAIGADVDLILDGGPCRYAKPSTVVRVGSDGMTVLREGVFDERYLRKLLKRTILFVCSGNTCRSPMAEAIARHELAKRLNVPADELDQHDWQIISAGVYAGSGAPATPEGVEAVKSLGIEPQPHRSRPLTVELLQQAELVLTMTDAHRLAVNQLLPTAEHKTARLDPGDDIDDPIGGSPAVYHKTAQRIAQLINARLDELGV